MLWILALVTVVGLVHSETTAGPNQLPPQLEWDCSNDHAPHPSDPRKFLQSANGFSENSDVTEAICPTRLQIFSQVGGLCRCSYRQDLADLLEQECQIRVPNQAQPDIYEILVPNRDVETVEELFKQQSCFNVLTTYEADEYIRQGIVPLFFNQTGCRCDWVPGVERIGPIQAPAGLQCERLIDQNFTNSAVNSDEVGNFIQIFPFQAQTNLTLSRGGSAFSNGVSEVIWRLPAIDFTELNIVLRFEADGGQNQLIAGNRCRQPATSDGGIFELQFNPSSRQYSLQFFSNRAVTCTVGSGQGIQNVQIRYNNATGVSLIVNNNECDVSSLNNDIVLNEAARLAFDSVCPLQIGSNLYIDPIQPNFGQTNEDLHNIADFQGVFYRVLVLRDCSNPPQMVSDRIAGNV